MASSLTFRSGALGAGLTMVLSACGSDVARTTSSTSRPAPVTTVAIPASTAAYAARAQAVLPVDSADAMAAVGGALWVKTDPGFVFRIDPATNKITDKIVVDKGIDQSQYCQGIGSDGASVWPCATRREGTGLAQIDPATKRVVRVVPATKVFDQLAIPATPRGLWLLTAEGTQVSVVDPASGKVMAYPLGARYLQLAAHGDRVVATSSVNGAVVAVDANTGRVVKRTTMNTPREAILIGTDVWVDTADGLTRLTRDLEARTVYKGVTAGTGGDIFAGSGSAWLRDSGGTIYRIDPATGRVLERISPADSLSGGSLITAFGSIWITDSEAGKVIRLRLDTNR
jgi:streptogramin lyase